MSLRDLPISLSNRGPLEATVAVAIAYLAHHPVPRQEIPSLLADLYAAFNSAMRQSNTPHLGVTALVVSSYLAHNVVELGDIPQVVTDVYAASDRIGASGASVGTEQASPTVAAPSSVPPEAATPRGRGPRPATGREVVWGDISPQALYLEWEAKRSEFPPHAQKSIAWYYLVSFEDHRKYRDLARHLMRIGMTPEEYRAKWDLPHDYPMLSGDLIEQRLLRQNARRSGH
jgi:predicted transcriptional regulator